MITITIKNCNVCEISGPAKFTNKLYEAFRIKLDLRPVFQVDDGLCRFVGTHQDMTQQKLLEARLREAELRNQFRYQWENPGYEFSLGGVKSLFAKGAYTADLDWAGAVAPDVDSNALLSPASGPLDRRTPRPCPPSRRPLTCPNTTASPPRCCC